MRLSTSRNTPNTTSPASTVTPPRTHPVSGPVTSPSTNNTDAAVANNVPTTSNPGFSAGTPWDSAASPWNSVGTPWDDGAGGRRPRGSAASTNGASTAAPSASGTITSSTHSQPHASVSTPPSSAPTASPPLPAAPHTDRARLRSGPSANPDPINASVAGVSNAPPRPCAARAATSTPWSTASPPARHASPNSTSPPTNARRAPSRSTTRPPNSRKPPSPTAYALSTHCRDCAENPSARPTSGSATNTML